MVSSVPTTHQSLLFTSTPPGRILPGLCGLIPNVIALPPLPHSPLTSPLLHLPCGMTSSMFKLMAVSLHTFVKRPPPDFMEEDAELNEDLTGNEFTFSHDTTIAFQELLSKIDSNTKKLPNVLSTKHHAALTQLPLTYPWARLVLDLKKLFISFDRHLVTCLIANQVQGNALLTRVMSYQVYSTTSLRKFCLSLLRLVRITHPLFFTTRTSNELNSGTLT